MLHINSISKIEVYTPEWQKSRLGCFTSSRISVLCGEDINTKGSISYIYQKVGEVLAGQLANEDVSIENENTAWGNQYENEAIRNFGIKMGISYLCVQKLIIIEGTQFASTPDALWVKGLCKNELEYNVSTVEVKCPPSYNRFIPLYLCKNPSDVKKVNPIYYWQVIDQMENCGSAVGYFVSYHPLFPKEANMGIVEFRKIDLWEDFKFLKKRKDQAVEKFNEIKAMFS